MSDDAPILCSFICFFEDETGDIIDADIVEKGLECGFEFAQGLSVAHPLVEHDDASRIFTGAIVAEALEASEE